jgi:hypothetical protein
MVMTRTPVRDNRIGFLGTLHGTMNRIADLSSWRNEAASAVKLVI